MNQNTSIEGTNEIPAWTLPETVAISAEIRKDIALLNVEEWFRDQVVEHSLLELIRQHHRRGVASRGENHIISIDESGIVWQNHIRHHWKWEEVHRCEFEQEGNLATIMLEGDRGGYDFMLL